jgi:hypothetical protein
MMSETLKIHYQNLKARCLEMAISMAGDDLPGEGASRAAVVELAKQLYNEITGEDWSGPDVAGG